MFKTSLKMKKALRIILYFLLAVFFIIILLIVVAAFSENRIARLVLEQAGKTTDIPIQVEKIEFSLIHDFPLATIRCKNMMIGEPESERITDHDTVAFLGNLYLAVQIRPLLKGVFEVRKIELEEAFFQYLADSAGTNIDFITRQTDQLDVDTSANDIHLNIEEFTLKNVSCIYSDSKRNAAAHIRFENAIARGLMDNNKISGEFAGKVIISDCNYDTTFLYRMGQMGVDFILAYENDELKIEKAEIAVDNDVLLGVNGKVLPEEQILDLNVSAKKMDLAVLSKYIPGNYFKEYQINDFSGMLKAEAQISGALSGSILPAVSASFELADGRLKYANFPVLQRIYMKGSATNGVGRSNRTTSLEIESLRFQTPQSLFRISGRIDNPEQPAYRLNARMDVDLEEAFPFLPDSLVQSLEGKIRAEFTTRGVLPDSISDQFIDEALAKTTGKFEFENVNANIDSTLSARQFNAEMDYRPGEIVIKNLDAFIPAYNLNVDSLNATVTGDITKPDSLEVRIDNLAASLEKSAFRLSGMLKNPFNPDYAVKGNFWVDLAEVASYLPDSMVTSVSGNVSGTFISAARLNPDSLMQQMQPVLFENSSFNLVLYDVNVELPDSMLCVQNLTGEMRYAADSLWINSLELNYLGMQVGMNRVVATPVYTTVLQNRPGELKVKGNFYADDVDYALLEKWMEEDSTATSAEPMNYTYKINGQLKTDRFKYDKALFTNIDSKFLVKPNYYVLDSLRMDAFDGKTLSSVKVEMPDGIDMLVHFKTKVSGMDVYKFMQAFDEYVEYEDFKAENVRGKVTGILDGRVKLNGNFEPEYETMMLKGELTLENGALLNVKPVMEIEKIPGVGLKNMDKLYFSTMNSSLFLFKNELYIPHTEIKSTSFDAAFLGMYSFGEDYDYHIRMFLGEVLSNKSKANLKKMMLEGGFDEQETLDATRGRTAIYLVSKSENGKEKAGFDRKKDRANMVAKVNLQKQMVDMNFHPALVNYNTEE